MQEIIDKMIQQNFSLFGSNPKTKKINVGFINTIYVINDTFIVKICTNINNEESFEKTIEAITNVFEERGDIRKLIEIDSIPDGLTFKEFNQFVNEYDRKLVRR